MNPCTTTVNFQLTTHEATALEAVVVHSYISGWAWYSEGAFKLYANGGPAAASFRV